MLEEGVRTVHHYELRAFERDARGLNPTPSTLDLTPYTLHPAPHTLNRTSYTLHPTPYTLNPTAYTLHPAPYTL